MIIGDPGHLDTGDWRVDTTLRPVSGVKQVRIACSHMLPPERDRLDTHASLGTILYL